MSKDKKLLFSGINLIFLLLAFFIWTLNGCGGSGGGGNGGGGNGGTTPAIITWAKSYGGSYDDEAYSIQQTAGGYIIAGVTQQDSNYEILVIKVDAYGNLIWQYTQPGVANSIINSGDGGYIVAGQLFPVPIGDIGVLKLNSNGNKEWEKNYGAYGGIANEVRQTSDGGYIIVGELLGDVYILKTDADGNREWGNTFGGNERDIGYSVLQTSNGFVVAGETILTGQTNPGIWIFKIDSNGNNIIWQEYFGGTGYDACYSIKITTDGGYIAVGEKSSSQGDADVWMAKLKDNGEIEWEKTYVSNNNERAYSINQITDGGFILAGEITADTGDTNILILKLNANGELIWQKTYGGSGNDSARSIQQTADDGYIVAGKITTDVGDTDFWVLKLDPNGNLN